MRLKHRNRASRKGDNGSVLVIAGSLDYTGSAFLCAMAIAALRSGIDLVTVAAPRRVAWALNAMSPDLITTKLSGENLSPQNFMTIKRLASKADVILIGPGIGKSASTKALVKKVIGLGKPMVIDADAIKLIKLSDVQNAIITPHRGELETLLGNSEIKQDELHSKLHGNIILAKGPTDTIYSEGKAIKVRGGNPGMTVGGTGDVLAGICAGLLSAGNQPLQSALIASKLNKKIGNRLNRQIGYGFIASDFLTVISKEAKKLRR